MMPTLRRLYRSHVLAWSIALGTAVALIAAAAFMWKSPPHSARLKEMAEIQAKLAALDNRSRRKVCAHRSNNLPMYREALRLFDCIEVDVVIEPPTGGATAAYHPPVKYDRGLTLDFLLRHERLPQSRLWLDVKDLSPENWETFLERLLRLIPPERRDDVIVETVWSSASIRTVATAFRSRGFAFSYYLPSVEAIDCGDESSQSCDALRRQVLSTLSQGFSHLSFDARAYPFVKSIHARMPRSVRLLTWDLRKSWPIPDLLAKVDVYIIHFPSLHADPHR